MADNTGNPNIWLEMTAGSPSVGKVLAVGIDLGCWINSTEKPVSHDAWTLLGQRQDRGGQDRDTWDSVPDEKQLLVFGLFGSLYIRYG